MGEHQHFIFDRSHERAMPAASENARQNVGMSASSAAPSSERSIMPIVDVGQEEHI